MYVKLFQLGGGGGVRSASQMNQFVTHMHAFSTKTQRTSGQKGSLRSCPVVLHRICPYNWTFKYDANVICTSLSVACALVGGWGGGNCCQGGGMSYAMGAGGGGGGGSPQGYVGSGAVEIGE